MNSLDTVTILAILVFIISLLDKSTVNKWISTIFIKKSPQLDSLNALINQRREIEIERNKLSAQDNYARWTKLNRRLDKLDIEIQSISSQIKSSNVTSTATISTIVTILLSSPQWILRLFYAKTAVMHLISGINTFPKPFSLILRFPWGKYNTVGAVFWAAAIDIVLTAIKNWIVVTKQLLTVSNTNNTNNNNNHNNNTKTDASK